ncbi:MAG: long-chain-acyl-CoA synthetase [Ideonella sp.]|jgi:fatty-acyl-CoA synthase|nr:long-chain-acyl-CoA synthetase [Ideonella sp.]MBL0149523.1 long-chain-acyl-CoA synthetase [Ideonella sp.]
MNLPNTPVEAPWKPVPREVTQAQLDRRAAIAARYRASDPATLADMLEAAALEHGPRPLLHCADRCFSYAEVNRLANQVAHVARAQGVRRGDVVALAMENRAQFFLAWFGLSKLGATVAFLNTNISGRALAHELQTTSARVALVGEECLPAFDAEEVRGCIPLWRWADADKPAPALHGLTAMDFGAATVQADEANPDASWRAGLTAGDPCVYIFTSGTTGLPKAAVISHARWLMSGAVMRETMSVVADDCFYTFLPLYHGAASLSAGSTAMAAGASLSVRRKFSKREFWADVRRHRITVCQYIGEICRYLLSEPERRDDRQHSLRTMVGAGLTAEVWTRFVERFGPMQIYEGWGSTEANTNTINVDNRPGSCGRVPFWDKTNLRLVRYDVEAEAHVRNADGFLVPCQPGEVGEAIGLLHDYPDIIAGRFEGYTAADETEKKILRNVFRRGDAAWASGDLLRCDEDGYCFFVDRMGDTFRWKSENVSTMEVADVLGELPGVESVTVYGVKVPGTEGRAGMAAVVMQEGHAFDPRDFHAHASAQLPRYAVPLFVRVPPEPDMTSTFKLRKVDLQRDGYDPARVADPLFVRDEAAQCYVPLSDETVARALAS